MDDVIPMVLIYQLRLGPGREITCTTLPILHHATHLAELEFRTIATDAAKAHRTRFEFYGHKILTADIATSIVDPATFEPMIHLRNFEVMTVEDWFHEYKVTLL